MVLRNSWPSPRISEVAIGPRWGWVLLLGHGTAAVLNLGWILLGLALARWLVRQAAEARPSTRLVYDSLVDRYRDRPPRLKVCSRTNRPVLVGVLGGTILIPPGLERPIEGERLRMSLAHELAHAERLDSFFCLLGRVTHAIWFFVPPLWWIAAQLRLDQEFLADRRATARLGASPISYASTLIEMAAPDRSQALVDPCAPRATASSAGSNLVLRVLMLLRCPFPVEGRGPAWWRWGMTMLALVGAVVVSTLSLRGFDLAAEGAAPRELCVATASSGLID